MTLQKGCDELCKSLKWIYNKGSSFLKIYLSYEERSDKTKLIDQMMKVNYLKKTNKLFIHFCFILSQFLNDNNLKWRKIELSQLHPDYCAYDLHLLLIGPNIENVFLN